jgi:hypothetical protein
MTVSGANSRGIAYTKIALAIKFSDFFEKDFCLCHKSINLEFIILPF